MNKRITNIIMGLLVVLLMGILVGCPTEAPKPKDKSGGGGDPIADVSINLSYTGSHSIVADVTSNIALDDTKEVAFVITDSSTKPTLPADVDTITTDGFISRKLIKGEPRKVYMAQLSTDLPTTASLGTHNDLDSLNDAYMSADTEYYLHYFYTKKDESDVIHAFQNFKTTLHRTTGAFLENLPDIEWKQGSENLNIVLDIKGDLTGLIQIKDHGANIVGRCIPTSTSFPLSCDDAAESSIILFEKALSGTTLIFLKNVSNTDDPIGIWAIVHNPNTYNFIVKKITE